MDRRSYLKSSLLLGGSFLMPAGVLALAGCSGTARSPELAGFDGQIMGTTYSVRLGVPLTEGLASKVHAALQNVDVHMSTWRGDSELSAFNDSADGDWQSMTPNTLDVMAQAINTSSISNGAFDVTIGPLVDLWGFGAGATKAGSIPVGRDINAGLAQVGYEAIKIDLEAGAARKLNQKARLDLSGIAKGHAVDRVAAVLNELGIDSYLVEVGGELKARGAKPDGSLWKVAIERPAVGSREVFRALKLNDQAIATSGDYRNFFDNGGQRYSHSIDPRTGQPVDHELASISVVADSTMAADAWSTALMVLGPDEAMALAKQHKVAAHMILKSGTSLKEVYSDTFEQLLT